MQLTESDIGQLDYDDGINWGELVYVPGITTPAEMYEKYKIPMPKIYKANLNGRISLGIKKPYDWVLIGKFSPLFTVKELSAIADIGLPAIYKAIKEHKIECKQFGFDADGRRDEKGRFKAK